MVFTFDVVIRLINLLAIVLENIGLSFKDVSDLIALRQEEQRDLTEDDKQMLIDKSKAETERLKRLLNL